VRLEDENYITESECLKLQLRGCSAVPNANTIASGCETWSQKYKESMCWRTGSMRDGAIG
jgi:hypothetical protein